MREALIAGEVRVPIDSDTDIVAARQNGRELAGWCGFPATDRVLVSTAISELARNIVRYATSGEIILRLVDDGGKRGVEVLRSEEHTSELQSRLHLVCRLLLEKKKKKDK